MQRRTVVEPWGPTRRHRTATTDVDRWAEIDGEPVAVVAHHPVGVDEAPVVVLAHGLGGSRHGYAELGRTLASHGLAVLHPEFLDSFALSGERLGMAPDGERTWARDEALRARMHEMLFDPVHWLSRVRRVHAVIDSLAAQSHLPLALRPDQVIVAGHSYGAYTAQLVLGAELHGVDLDASVLRHPAAAAGLLLSPQGSGDRGLTPSSWASVTHPLLVVTATGDRGPHGEGLAWRREPYDAAPARTKHLAVVDGGDHLFGGIDLPAEEAATRPDHRSAVVAVCTAFVDWVHGDRAAGAWLGSRPYEPLIHHEHRGDLHE